ncbi:hypothetical protein LTR87_016706 [Friedmanniomyces endolithicus]|nr:hypothetical protein LTR87_016706 [Friedmanniomyces endolithicus]
MKPDDYDLKDDELDRQDKEELKHFEELLKPFHTITKRVEGHASEGSYGAEYYNYTDVSRIYRGAVAFHPSKRFTLTLRGLTKEAGVMLLMPRM